MKPILLLLSTCLIHYVIIAQTKDRQYPDGEFSNEIYYLRKDTVKLVRLEKDLSEMETKTKLGGMAGAEIGYTIEKEKSPVRFPEGQPSFVFYIAVMSSVNASQDSVLRANGIDPAILQENFTGEPTRGLSLYSLSVSKGQRKALMYNGSQSLIVGKSNKKSNKYGFSVKKIREGYYEIIPDKALPKGEYAFVMMTDQNHMTGSQTIFAFGID